MFSLIIVIISVVLVGVLAVATVYFGGDVFSSGGAQAEASALLAQAAQIASAAAAYGAQHHGAAPPSLQALIDEQYLSSVPPGWAPDSGEGALSSKVIESENACKIFNEKQGVEGIPACEEVTTLFHPICCK